MSQVYCIFSLVLRTRPPLGPKRPGSPSVPETGGVRGVPKGPGDTPWDTASDTSIFGDTLGDTLGTLRARRA